MRRTDDDDVPIRIVDADTVIRVVDDTDDEMRDGETLHVRMNMMDSTRFAFDAADLADHTPGFRDEARALEAYRRYCRDMGLPSHRVSDAVVRDARTAWLADMQNAWRGDARASKIRRLPEADPDPDENDDEPEGSAGQFNRQYRSRRERGWSAMPFKGDARDEYVRRLTDAWKHETPASDASQPDLGTRPEDPRAPSGVTDPNRASNLEEQVERVRGRAWATYRTTLENAWKNPPGVHPPQRAQVGPAGPSDVIAAVASPDPAVRTRRVSSGPGAAGGER
jgi:hypothetical protein